MSSIRTMWLPRPPANAITTTVVPRQQQQEQQQLQQQQQQLPPVPQPPQPQQQLPTPPPLPDLLAHKHRPISVDTLDCHREQARRLRQWILDFTNAPRNDSRHGNSGNTSDSDYDDEGAMSDDSEAEDQTARRCILLTGPPGVGKTSLVHLVANELKMHVVESHSSEKRDFRLFKMLKLANQKGKINPIARLFQLKQQKDQTTGGQLTDHKSRRKRRKTEEMDRAESSSAQTEPKSQSLSLSGGSSIVLFDDIDVVFDEDGPFLKSLAEFIRESKRPVIVTATRFIEHIKSTLVHFEHIQLNKPHLDDCVKLLRDVCRRERYFKIDKVTNCRIIAKKLNCDIRQCLNRVHFYGDAAFINIDMDTSEIATITPDFSRLSGHLEHLAEKLEDEEKTDVDDDDDDDSKTILAKLPNPEHDVTPTALSCYDTASLLDLMDSALDLVDRSTLLTRWLEGQPSNRSRVQSYEHELGEQIRRSITELAGSLHKVDLLKPDDKCNAPNKTLDQTVSMSLFGDLPGPCDKHRQSPIPIAARMRLRPRKHVEIFNG